MDEKALKIKVIAAFAAVYVAWGSTYLAIRFAVESIPPCMMAAVRYLIAGTILYIWSRSRGVEAPKPKQWIPATIMGVLLLVFGNGAVVLAEQTVPSGVVSLLVAMVPVYFALLEWWRPGGKPPGLRVATGLVVGILGLILLIGPGNISSNGAHLDLRGISYVLVGSICWSIGSVFSRQLKSSDSPSMGIALQTLAAGVIFSIISICFNEPEHLNLAAISAKSIWSVVYLIIFGSLIGFTAYVWLLQNVKSTLVSTYAYVNPVVAVFLGWAVAGESLSSQTMLAAGVILLAVWIITQAKAKPTPVSAGTPVLASAKLRS